VILRQAANVTPVAIAIKLYQAAHAIIGEKKIPQNPNKIRDNPCDLRNLKYVMERIPSGAIFRL
jgi:hypothetical protein